MRLVRNTDCAEVSSNFKSFVLVAEKKNGKDSENIKTRRERTFNCVMMMLLALELPKSDHGERACHQDAHPHYHVELQCVL